jgi:hypothetical protein
MRSNFGLVSFLFLGFLKSSLKKLDGEFGFSSLYPQQRFISGLCSRFNHMLKTAVFVRPLFEEWINTEVRTGISIGGQMDIPPVSRKALPPSNFPFTV